MPPFFPSARSTTRRLAALAVVGLIGAGSLVACSSSGSGDPNTITLYNAQHEQTTAALISAFTKQTGIKVRQKDDDEDVLTAQIEQEGSRSPADVFYTENGNWLEQLDQKGLLAKTDANTLANVPAADSAANGDWVGVSARISAIVYNPSKISAAALPKSILDMANPEYKGKFELAPAETDFWPLVSSVAKAKGDSAALTWLKAIKANAGSNDAVPDNETVVSDVNKGTIAFGVINHYYFYRMQSEIGKSKVHAKLACFAAKDPGFVQDISGIGVLKSSKHEANAQKFVNFVTSSAGQAILEKGASFEYPLKAGVAANPELPPLASYATTAFTPADLGTGLLAKTLLQKAGLL